MTEWSREEQAEHRKELVAALRSGKYQQGRNKLRRGDYFCCLGVAEDVRGCTWELNDVLEGGKFAADISLSENGRLYYGFTERDPIIRHAIVIQNAKCTSLAGMNDSGATFSEIADVIESGGVEVLS